MSKTQQIRAIARYGQTYRIEHLRNHITRRSHYRQDAHAALLFYFNYMFMRGCRDELSMRFYERACEVLTEIKSEDPHYFSCWDGHRSRQLEARLQDKGVNNHGDRKMIRATLEWLHTKLAETDYNIVEYAIQEIRNHRLSQLYERLDAIPWVGDKLASFFLRDVVDIYKLERWVDGCTDAPYLQPIDTWVQQVAQAIRILAPNAELKIARRAIVLACHNVGASPIRFNQGAWYVGANSLDILLNEFGRRKHGEHL